MKELSKDTLGNRMKRLEEEAISHDGEISQSPVVIRLDGCAFHSWAKKMGLDRPFDSRFLSCMQSTLLHLCESVPSCVFGYTQSDEISICLRNDMSSKSTPWFDNRIQKLASVTSSIATFGFNALSSETFEEPIPAYFDSRVIYVSDVTEAVNHFIWRQNDCIRNSVQSMAQSLYPQKYLQKIGTEELKQMIQAKGQDWSLLPTYQQRGAFCIKHLIPGEYEGTPVMRRVWTVDLEPPRISKNKQYLLDSYYLKKPEVLPHVETVS